MGLQTSLGLAVDQPDPRSVGLKMGELGEGSPSSADENVPRGCCKITRKMNDALVVVGCTKGLGPSSLLTEQILSEQGGSCRTTEVLTSVLLEVTLRREIKGPGYASSPPRVLRLLLAPLNVVGRCVWSC